MARTKTQRFIGKVLIAVAVLAPMALVLAGIVYSHLYLLTVKKRGALILIVADLVLLSIGYALNRGEDL